MDASLAGRADPAASALSCSSCGRLGRPLVPPLRCSLLQSTPQTSWHER
jgi:hypothetical protein